MQMGQRAEQRYRQLFTAERMGRQAAALYQEELAEERAPLGLGARS